MGVVDSGTQETFCFQSDTLSCAQFYDPSMQYNDEGVLMWSIITGTLVALLVLLICCDHADQKL